MNININGEAVETSTPDILSLVRARNLDPSSLVVEHNHTIIQQAAWADTLLQQGDTIELLSFVGGG
ncbi:MAG: sulfur carrier protein ThiS [Desulfotignum sp.]|nr:sulfur carrier protein ThiS [Desulfobacteraceae bacterium]